MNKPLFKGIVLSVSWLAMVLVSGCSTGEEKREVTDKERAVFLVQSAAGALQGGDPTQALRDLSDAELISPDMPELHHTRALAFFAKQEPQLALESVRVATKLNPKFSPALNTMGKLLIDLGYLKDAEAPLKAAATDLYYRESYKARTNLGILYFKLDRIEDSEREVTRAIASEPNLACMAYFYRGNINLRKNKFPSAIDDYTKATRKFCGSFSNAYYMQGVAFMKDRQFSAARKKFLEVTKLFPGTEDSRRAADQLRYLP